jgi:hypothetical protein
VGLLIILAVAASFYALYRATKTWGVAVLYFFAAFVGFLGAAGIVAERLWGPRWSWNASHHHDLTFAFWVLLESIVFLVLGLANHHRRTV